MKDKTKRLFQKLVELTAEKCSKCPAPDQHRCCSKMFCSLVEGSLRDQGIPMEKPNVGGIPYMGPSGCIVPPELRPFCTGFVCNVVFQDREIRREYDRILNKISQDPEAPKMPKIKH